MATFRYVGVGPEGNKVHGSIEGFTAEAVTADLLDRGLEQVKVRQKRSLREVEVTKKKVKPTALMHLSRQLAAFVRAGVPLLDALRIVQEEVSDRALRKVVLSIADALRRGETLHEAAAAQGKVFPPFYLGVLKSAEVTGQLDDVLDQLALYLQRDLEAKKKIRSALAYPALIMLMSIVTVVVLAVFVLPRFKVFFDEFDAELPLPTRMLIAFTSFLTAWGITMVVAGTVVAVAIGLSQLTRRGRKAKDVFLLKLPLVRDVVQYAVIERFCRLLGAMIKGGIPLPDAMVIASDGANNLVYLDQLEKVREAMIEGEGLAEPITRTKLFPPSATSMMRVGEETGSLETQLDVTARYYEQELGFKLKNLTTLFEPMAIIFVGAIVGFVSVALVSAIYGVYRQVNFQ